MLQGTPPRAPRTRLPPGTRPPPRTRLPPRTRPQKVGKKMKKRKKNSHIGNYILKYFDYTVDRKKDNLFYFKR